MVSSQNGKKSDSATFPALAGASQTSSTKAKGKGKKRRARTSASAGASSQHRGTLVPGGQPSADDTVPGTRSLHVRDLLSSTDPDSTKALKSARRRQVLQQQQNADSNIAAAYRELQHDLERARAKWSSANTAMAERTTVDTKKHGSSMASTGPGSSIAGTGRTNRSSGGKRTAQRGKDKRKVSKKGSGSNDVLLSILAVPRVVSPLPGSSKASGVSKTKTKTKKSSRASSSKTTSKSMRSRDSPPSDGADSDNQAHPPPPRLFSQRETTATMGYDDSDRMSPVFSRATVPRVQSASALASHSQTMPTPSAPLLSTSSPSSMRPSRSPPIPALRPGLTITAKSPPPPPVPPHHPHRRPAIPRDPPHDFATLVTQGSTGGYSKKSTGHVELGSGRSTHRGGAAAMASSPQSPSPRIVGRSGWKESKGSGSSAGDFPSEVSATSSSDDDEDDTGETTGRRGPVSTRDASSSGFIGSSKPRQRGAPASMTATLTTSSRTYISTSAAAAAATTTTTPHAVSSAIDKERLDFLLGRSRDGDGQLFEPPAVTERRKFLPQRSSSSSKNSSGKKGGKTGGKKGHHAGPAPLTTVTDGSTHIAPAAHVPRSPTTLYNKIVVRSEKQARPYALIHPLNYESEKAVFLFDNSYNPQFEYNDVDKVNNHVHKYGVADDLYLDIAIQIMEKVIERYGTETGYTHSFGRLLTQEECVQRVHNYLVRNNLEDKVRVCFTPHAIAPTSMGKTTMNIRLPVEYREHRMEGVLSHEIGTHYLRRVNNERQVWHKRRKKYSLKGHIATEEGLACLQQHMCQPQKYLWHAALHYYTAYKASRMSFSKLYNDLRRWVDDPHRRWIQCMRAKRGQTDTSKPGSFAKDQVYLRGALEILANRRTIDFVALYSGKIALSDVEFLKPLIKDPKGIKLPHMMEDMARYRQLLDEVAKANGLTAQMLARCK